MDEAEQTNTDRISTGIDGLDTLLYGGVPINNQTIVAGGPGSGKTLLSFQILYNNAKKGIPGAFIALEERPNSIIKNVKKTFTSFTDIDELIEKETIVVGGEDITTKVDAGSDSEAYSFGNVVSDIESIVKSNNSKCVVIDSISLMKLMLGNLLLYRKSMVALSANLRRLNVTGFLTIELPSTERTAMTFSPEFFIFDGTIVMYQSWEENKRTLNIEVIKMRGSNHSLSLSPYEITTRGFRVFSVSEL
jgi:circadian clock protein KaiC